MSTGSASTCCLSRQQILGRIPTYKERQVNVLPLHGQTLDHLQDPSPYRLGIMVDLGVEKGCVCEPFRDTAVLYNCWRKDRPPQMAQNIVSSFAKVMARNIIKCLVLSHKESRRRFR